MKKLFATFVACFILVTAGVEKAPDALKVVFYCDRGVGVDLVGRLMDECPEFIVTFANGKEIGEGALDGADMVVHSGGSGESQFFGLGEKGVAAEREFVKKGGLYHGTCAGAFLVLEETRRKRNQMVPFKPDDRSSQTIRSITGAAQRSSSTSRRRGLPRWDRRARVWSATMVAPP